MSFWKKLQKKARSAFEKAGRYHVKKGLTVPPATMRTIFKRKPKSKPVVFRVGAGMTAKQKKAAEKKIKDMTRSAKAKKAARQKELFRKGQKLEEMFRPTKAMARGAFKGMTLGAWSPKTLKPDTKAEKEKYKYWEAVPEFATWMLPFGGVSKGIGLAGKLALKAKPIAKMAKIGAKIPMAGKMAKGAAPFAAISALEKPEEGKTRGEAAKWGAGLGAIFPMLGGGLKIMGKPLSKLIPVKKIGKASLKTLKNNQQKIIKSEAEFLRTLEKKLKTVKIRSEEEAKMVSIASEHNVYFREFYKQFHRAPNKKEWLEIAQKELEAGKSGLGLGKYYRKIAEQIEKKGPKPEEIKVEDVFGKADIIPKKVEPTTPKGIRAYSEKIKRMVKEFRAERAGKPKQEIIAPRTMKQMMERKPGAVEKILEREKWKGIREGVQMGRIEEATKKPKTINEIFLGKPSVVKIKGVKPQEVSKMITRPEKVLLRERIRAEARGAKEAKRTTRAEMIKMFKDSQTEIKQLQNEVFNYIKDTLPATARGKFIGAIRANLTKKKMVSIFERVGKEKERIDLRKEFAELKAIKKAPNGNIAVDYQKKISEIISGVDLAKPTDKTIRKLKGLQGYIEKNGEPLGIQVRHIENLKRLTQKNAGDMTLNEARELKNTIKHLEKLGKLKNELKYKYNQREKAVALQKLVKSTNNIDPKVPEEGAKFYETRLNLAKRKADVKKVYMDTLHTPRVADMIDGFKGYQGENAKYIKKLWNAEMEAKTTTQEIVSNALEEIKKLGIKELDKKQMARIMINIRYKEGAYDQVKTLMEKHGYKEIPKITEKEGKLIEIIKKHINKYSDDIAPVFEEIENKPFGKLKEYILPIKYEKDFNLIPSAMIEQGRYRTTQAFKGFTFARQKGVKRTPRTDLFGVFEEAINEQQWYLKTQPQLENIKHVVKTPEYLEAGGEMAANFWKDVLDVVARRGWSATAQSNPILRGARLNLNNAILGYKASSAMMQPFAIFDAMAYAQSRFGSIAALRVLNEFGKTWINPKYAGRIIKESRALPLRKAGEIAIEESLARAKGKGLLKKVQRGGLAGLQWGDVKTAAGVERGLYNTLKKQKIPNAKKEAEFLMNMVSGSADTSLRPLILSHGEGARTWFTFQSFFLNRWGIQIHDLIRGGIIGGKGFRKKLAALIGLGIFMGGAIAENEARMGVYRFVKGEEKKKDESLLTEAAMSIPENVPYFGNVISGVRKGWGAGEPPIMRVVESTFQGGKNIFAEKEATRIKGGIKMSEGIMSAVFGVPGTAQIADILERVLVGPSGGGKSKSTKKTPLGDIFLKGGGEEELPSLPGLETSKGLPPLPGL